MRCCVVCTKSIVTWPLTALIHNRHFISQATKSSRHTVKFRNYATVRENISNAEYLPQSPVRARFAPSPTGYLHLGSLRTAVYNYLIAKRTGGEFILRIEDTDRKRTVEDAQTRLLADLKWAGLVWDEGPDVGGDHEPYNQSQRTKSYQKYTENLIASGDAYRCFCPIREVSVNPQETSPDAQAGQLGACTQSCATISSEIVAKRLADGAKAVVRFSPSNDINYEWKDIIYGSQGQQRFGQDQTSTIRDVVLLKSDGTPTYHMANVVDDHLMKISHVIRGTEWMSSTPLHVALYKSLGWEPPQFAHVSLLTDEEGRKLSKRNSVVDIAQLRDEYGLLPESLVNFLALMGWRNTTKSDVMSMTGLEQAFDLKFSKGNTIVSLKKLWFLQKHHAAERIAKAIESVDQAFKIDPIVKGLKKQRSLPNLLEDAQNLLSGRNLDTFLRCILIVDPLTYGNSGLFLERNKMYFMTNATGGETAPEFENHVEEFLKKMTQELISEPNVKKVTNIDYQKDDLNAFEINDILTKAKKVINDKITQLLSMYVSDEKDMGKRELNSNFHKYLRWKLTFCNSGPSIAGFMSIIGYKECTDRLCK